MAETYHIYDYKQLPVSMVAVFVCGLRENSRIMMKINDTNVSLDTLLMASVADRLGLLIWQKTKDGQRNRNRPVSLVEQLNKKKEERQELSFASGKEFEATRLKLLNEMEGKRSGD